MQQPLSCSPSFSLPFLPMSLQIGKATTPLLFNLARQCRVATSALNSLLLSFSWQGTTVSFAPNLFLPFLSLGREQSKPIISQTSPLFFSFDQTEYSMSLSPLLSFLSSFLSSFFISSLSLRIGKHNSSNPFSIPFLLSAKTTTTSAINLLFFFLSFGKNKTIPFSSSQPFSFFSSLFSFSSSRQSKQPFLSSFLVLSISRPKTEQLVFSSLLSSFWTKQGSSSSVSQQNRANKALNLLFFLLSLFLCSSQHPQYPTAANKSLLLFFLFSASFFLSFFKSASTAPKSSQQHSLLLFLFSSFSSSRQRTAITHKYLLLFSLSSFFLKWQDVFLFKPTTSAAPLPFSFYLLLSLEVSREWQHRTLKFSAWEVQLGFNWLGKVGKAA